MAGSIRRRGKRSWEVSVWLGRDPKTHRARRRYATVRGTRKDAEHALTAMQREHDLGIDLDPERITVDAFLRRWLRDSAEPAVAELTLRCYRENCNRLSALIGDLRLYDLRPAHIQGAYRQLAAEGLKPRTIIHHHRVLKHALKDAVRWQLVARNVADAVDPPRAEATEMQVLDTEGIARLLAACKDDDFRTLVYVATTTGLRQGELLGLKWGDCDLDRGQASIQRARQYRPGDGLFFKTPKTARSRRNIALSRETVEELRAHRKAQIERRLRLGTLYQHGDLVFPDEDGRPLSPTKVWARFPKLVKAAGVGPLRFHDLRHSAATQMINAGMHARAVAQQLGHATPSLVMNVYAHVLPDVQHEAILAIDGLIRRPARNG